LDRIWKCVSGWFLGFTRTILRFSVSWALLCPLWTIPSYNQKNSGCFFRKQGLRRHRQSFLVLGLVLRKSKKKIKKKLKRK
jgi:hypothetical protein